MIQVDRKQQGKTLILHLSGAIDEAAFLEAAIGQLTSDTILNLREISRVSSAGCRAWALYFRDQVARGAQLRFVECSPAVVEQINLISNFSAGGKVESVCLPFLCSKKNCATATTELLTIDELKKINFNPPSVRCTKCGGDAVFDDIAEEYFRFAVESVQ